jgi:hypothetical protein
MTGVIRRRLNTLTHETRAMSGPKFRPGQIVEFIRAHHMAPRGEYEVLRSMPSDVGEARYRIRSLHETHERVAWEHELRAVPKE